MTRAGPVVTMASARISVSIKAATRRTACGRSISLRPAPTSALGSCTAASGKGRPAAIGRSCQRAAPGDWSGARQPPTSTLGPFLPFSPRHTLHCSFPEAAVRTRSSEIYSAASAARVPSGAWVCSDTASSRLRARAPSKGSSSRRSVGGRHASQGGTATEQARITRVRKLANAPVALSRTLLTSDQRQPRAGATCVRTASMTCAL